MQDIQVRSTVAVDGEVSIAVPTCSADAESCSRSSSHKSVVRINSGMSAAGDDSIGQLSVVVVV
jgi:hypothetical protein